VLSENNNITAQPIPVRVKEPTRTFLGSYRSARGPKITAPKDIPTYIIDIAYPDITELSG
jgi:hypothetical protein